MSSVPTLPSRLASPRLVPAPLYTSLNPLARAALRKTRLPDATPGPSGAVRRGPLRPAGAATWAPSSALGQHRSNEVLGVVILDAGRPTPEGDDLLLDFAAAYGQAYRREVVSVANPATLEHAVRGCKNSGASRVMVVPYLLSSGRSVDADIPMALADVQLKMPGIRCVISETIDIQSLLAQQIENSVKVVDVKPPEMPAERWWRPEPAVMQEDSSASRSRAAPAGVLPAPAARQQRAWADAVEVEVEPQPRVHGPSSPQQPPRPNGTPRSQASTAASQQAMPPSASPSKPITPPTAAPSPPTPTASQFSAAAASSAAAPAATATRAATPPPAAGPAANSWSDDFSLAMSGGVVVVDYRSAPSAKLQAEPAPAKAAVLTAEAAVVAAEAATAAEAVAVQPNTSPRAATTTLADSLPSLSSSTTTTTTITSPLAAAADVTAPVPAPVPAATPAAAKPASRPAPPAPPRQRSAWDRLTSRLVALSAIPNLFLSLPLLLAGQASTAAAGAAAWAALPASIVGICSSALLFSFFSARGEATAVAVQGQSLLVGLAAVAQLCVAGSLPGSVLASLVGLVGVQAVVFASPQLSQRLSSSAEGRWLKGAWTRVVGVVGLATAVQALWPAIQARLATLSGTQLALATGSAALVAVATSGRPRLPAAARRSTWPAAAFFLLQPASLALTAATLSPGAAALATLASALAIPRALWTGDRLWLAGSLWGTALGWGQLMMSTGAGLQAPMLATFTALLAGGCALASYRNFRERLASATA